MSIQLEGSLYITGSITASAGLLGTSSYANNALSSSYAVTASYALNGGSGGGGFPYTGSAEISGSLTVNGLDINGQNGLTYSEIVLEPTPKYIDISNKNYVRLILPTSSTVWNPTYLVGFTGSTNEVLSQFVVDAIPTSSLYQYANIQTTSSNQYFVSSNGLAVSNFTLLNSSNFNSFRVPFIVESYPSGNVKWVTTTDIRYRTVTLSSLNRFNTSSIASLYQFVSGSDVWNTTIDGTGSIYNLSNTSSVINIVTGNTASWSNTAIPLNYYNISSFVDHTGYYCSPTVNGFLSSSVDTITFSSASGGLYGAFFITPLGLTIAQTQSKYVLARAEDDSFEFFLKSNYFLQAGITYTQYTPYLSISQSAYVITGSAFANIDSGSGIFPTSSAFSNYYVGFAWTNNYVGLIGWNTSTLNNISGNPNTTGSNITGTLPPPTTTNIEYWGSSAESNANFIGVAIGCALYTGSLGNEPIYSPTTWVNQCGFNVTLPNGLT